MKNCRNIRWELSAYLDGELAPPQRTEVEAHLASCARCQRELLEIKTLVTGVAALPKLQPAPRFLTEVRRKIARGEKPEAPTWQDHIFRPLWLKIPLEAAALIVIIGLALRSEHSLPARKIAPLEFAKAENGLNEHGNSVSSETGAKAATASEPKLAVAAQAPAIGTPALTIVDDKKQLLDGSAASGIVAGGPDNRAATGPRRIPVISSSDELSSTPPSTLSPSIDLIQSIEFPRSKPSEIVTVHARVFDYVRNQAQQLAARCSGRVVVVPASKDATEQTFFVELPQEYVAAFKLELLKTTGLAKGGIGGESGSTSAAAASAGVLTGNAPTNNSSDGLAKSDLRGDTTTAAPATLLEIRVVPSTN